MVSDLSANNLSEDKVADPPMLGSLLLEGIWSRFFLSGQRMKVGVGVVEEYALHK